MIIGKAKYNQLDCVHNDNIEVVLLGKSGYCG